MKIYHFVVGDMAAKPIKEALSEQDSHEIIILKDILNVGPLIKEDGQSFSELRSAFWQKITASEKLDFVLQDMEQVLAVSKEMYHDEQIVSWFWMAPLPADVCAYYWLLYYLSKHQGRFLVINIAGLPFLDDIGKLFFPKSIADIAPKEIIKATKLARVVTPSEIEVDTYEWKNIQATNAPIRSLVGGKRINNQSIDFYDNLLIAKCTNSYQKAAKIVQAAIVKESNIPTGDTYLLWRLNQLVEAGYLQIQNHKNSKEFEVKLIDSENHE